MFSPRSLAELELQTRCCRRSASSCAPTRERWQEALDALTGAELRALPHRPTRAGSDASSAEALERSTTTAAASSRTSCWPRWSPFTEADRETLRRACSCSSSAPTTPARPPTAWRCGSASCCACARCSQRSPAASTSPSSGTPAERADLRGAARLRGRELPRRRRAYASAAAMPAAGAASRRSTRIGRSCRPSCRHGWASSSARVARRSHKQEKFPRRARSPS